MKHTTLIIIMLTLMLVLSIQCTTQPKKKPALYSDQEALVFKTRIAELDFPTTIYKACITMGIKRSRLEYSRVYKSQGVFGSMWAQLSDNYFIAFYFSTPQPENPAKSPERIHKVTIVRDKK